MPRTIVIQRAAESTLNYWVFKLPKSEMDFIYREIFGKVYVPKEMFATTDPPDKILLTVPD